MGQPFDWLKMKTNFTITENFMMNMGEILTCVLSIFLNFILKLNFFFKKVIFYSLVDNFRQVYNLS